MREDLCLLFITIMYLLENEIGFIYRKNRLFLLSILTRLRERRKITVLPTIYMYCIMEMLSQYFMYEKILIASIYLFDMIGTFQTQLYYDLKKGSDENRVPILVQNYSLDEGVFMYYINRTLLIFNEAIVNIM